MHTPYDKGFPNENISPKKKALAPFLRQYAYAAYHQVLSRKDDTVGYPSRNRYQKARDYAESKQSVEHIRLEMDKVYAQRIRSNSGHVNGVMNDGTLVSDRVAPGSPLSAGNYPESLFRPIPIYSTLFRTNVALVLDSSIDVRIDPIDAAAAEEMAQQRRAIESKIIMRQQAQAAGNAAMAANPMFAPAPGEPEDMEELEASQITQRHRAAFEAEMLVAAAKAAGNWKHICELGIADALNCGLVVKRDVIRDDMPLPRYMDPSRLFVSWFQEPDGSDIRWAGELLSVRASDLRTLVGVSFEEEDLTALWATEKTTYPTYEQWLGERIFEVLDLEIISDDTVYKEVRRDGYGNIKLVNSTPDKGVRGGKKVSKANMGLYRVKWIVGTELVYDYGKGKVQPRSASDPQKVRTSIHISGVWLRDMTTFSRTLNVATVIDSTTRAFIRWQHALNTAIPDGISVDVRGLEGLEEILGDTYNPVAVIEALLARGVLVWASADPTDPNAKPIAPPISKILSGTGQQLKEFIDSFSQLRELMKLTLGLNDVTDASTPNQRMLNGVASMAVASTNNAVKDVSNAMERVELSMVEALVLRARVLVKSGRDKAIRAALGRDTVQFFNTSTSFENFTMGFRIERRPSAQEEAALEADISAALTTGQINLDDRLFLRTIDNPKQRATYLASRIRRNEKKRAQDAERNTRITAEMQQQAAVAASNNRIRELSADWGLRTIYMREEKAYELQIANVQGNWNAERGRTEASGRKEAAGAQAAQRESESVREVQLKLIEMGRPDLAALVTPDPLSTEVVENARKMIPQKEEEKEQMSGNADGEGFDFSGSSITDMLNSKNDPLTSGGQPLRFTPPPDLQIPDWAMQAPDGVGAAQEAQIPEEDMATELETDPMEEASVDPQQEENEALADMLEDGEMEEPYL